jgi:hypothetical protein
VPYPLWAEDGFVTPTPGNVVDFRAVEDKIRALCEQSRCAKLRLIRTWRA